MIIIYFFIGTVIGSFLCLVAERIPKGKSIVFPTSHCIHCKRKLHFFELIPLFSILFLKFRCRTCKQKLSIIYFISELISGLLLSSLLILPIEATNYFLLLFSALTYL